MLISLLVSFELLSDWLVGEPRAGSIEITKHAELLRLEADDREIIQECVQWVFGGLPREGKGPMGSLFGNSSLDMLKGFG